MGENVHETLNDLWNTSYIDYTVEDPEESRGGEIGGVPYPQPSLISHLIKQLMPGQDLTRVLIPVYYLYPRSLLEHLGDMLMHIDLLDSPDLQSENPYNRFMLLLKWYLSSWHYQIHGCKKPYNPIIGETFACVVDTGESRVSYIAEQCSHHPPISAFYLENQKKQYCVNGYIWTQSKFTGNCALSSMVGDIAIYLPRFGDEYHTMIPAYAATGLFLGTLRMQLIDKVVFECPSTQYRAEIEFHCKPMIGGEVNCVSAIVFHKGEEIHHIYGKWNECFLITNAKDENIKTFLDIPSMKVLPKRVLDIPYQGEMESRRLWNSVTQAIQQPEGPDWDRVQREKTLLEEEQRALPCHQPADSPQFKPWKPKFFIPIPHTGKGKMKTGYQFMYFDLKMVRPDAPYRDFLALSRNAYDERIQTSNQTLKLMKEK